MDRTSKKNLKSTGQFYSNQMHAFKKGFSDKFAAKNGILRSKN